MTNQVKINKRHKTTFGDLVNGAIFIYRNALFVKVAKFKTQGSMLPLNAIRLNKDGSLSWFADEVHVSRASIEATEL